MKIKVLYEDTNILVIDKPAGFAVHENGKTKEPVLTDWILKNYPKMKNVGEPMQVKNLQVESSKVHKVKSEENFKHSTLLRPGIVHRLDKETSGVLILAKNQKAHEFLKKQFSAPALAIAKGALADKQDRIKKIYHCVVQGWIKEDRGVINKPIGRSPSDFRKRLAGRGARGELKEAVTEYRVLKRFVEDGNKFTYLEVRPKTGRTHQIRVHLKFLNHPIVCDELYNKDKPAPRGFTRLALHAKSIEFKNLKGETLKIEAPLPKEFLGIFK